ncbi:hypothetical protein GWI33_018854 [Rhynchophorus ferrugineus]|uniref:Uncharacterized protein n=1 Tax=Rhynchophorus ferrugineus TaxID=354439 RepID=A0A834HU46_RHYFE|nr:hypothetical protein GWI33_018854 [Rhynchophorus ferrugineus]
MFVLGLSLCLILYCGVLIIYSEYMRWSKNQRHLKTLKKIYSVSSNTNGGNESTIPKDLVIQYVESDLEKCNLETTLRNSVLRRNFLRVMLDDDQLFTEIDRQELF